MKASHKLGITLAIATAIGVAVVSTRAFRTAEPAATAPGSSGAIVAEPAPIALTLGTGMRGEITSRTPINYRDGSRGVLYGVNLREGQVASFQVTGPPARKSVGILRWRAAR